MSAPTPVRTGRRVGLDVGGTKVDGVLLPADGGAPLARVRVPTRRGADGVVESVSAAVTELCVRAGVPIADLDGVGLGVPGLVDPAAGVVAHAVNLGIEDPLPLGPLLEARLGVPVALENDLNAAALGVAAAMGLEDVALLALGTGLAAGLVLDGRLRRGHRGAAGEIGHVPYVAGGPACPCGQRGCLELYASGSAVDAAWSAVLARRGAAPSGTPAPAAVLAAAAAGDPDAAAVRDAFADAVAAAVRILVLTCDVEHVVLGGGVAELGEPLAEAVRAAARRQAHGSAFLTSLDIGDRVAVVPAGTPVGPLGAALAVRDGRRTEAVAWRS